MSEDDITNPQLAFSFEGVVCAAEPAAVPTPPPARPTPPKPTPPKAAPAKPAPLTAARMLERIRTDEGLPKNKRKDWLSRLNTLFRVTGTDVHAPLDRPRLIGLLDQLASGHRGLRQQSIYNIRSAVHGIADRYGIVACRPRPADLSAPWRAIYQGSDPQSIWRPISSLAYWADARGHAPGAVDQPLFEEFLAHLRTETLER